MPIAEVRINHFRAYSDTGTLRFGSLTPIVGKNDSGKSVILHALRIFFEPPRKGGIDKSDLHRKVESCLASIEVSFIPQNLRSSEIKVDAKNKIHIVDDCLVDANGLLKLRISLSTRGIEAFQIFINDVDYQEFYPLALKKHDELIELLNEVGLPAKRAGKETNQEKRTALRDFAISKGASYKEDWVDANSIEKPIRDILPKFIFFTDSAKYAISETAVQNQFKGIVDRALSGHPNAQQIEEDIKTTIQTEFDKLHDRLSRLTDTVASIEATPKVSWKKAVDGIGLSWGDSLGVDLPYELRGAGIRRLFMVAYFQYEAAASMHDPDGSQYVFAIEEPELHLHPGAQRDLVIALKEIGDLGHCVVFTTHSPVFSSSARIDDLILVSRSNVVAEAKQTPNIDIVNVAHELGVEASDRLIGKNHVILVEGPRDVEFYTTILTELHNNGDTSLAPSSVLFLQCGGVSNLRFSVTTKCIDEAGLKWAVIVDSDKQSATGPYGRDTQYLIDNCPSTCSCLLPLTRTAIENYLDQSIVKSVTGIDCIIPQYGKPTDISGAPLDIQNLKTIKKSVANIAQAMGATGIVSMSLDSSGQCEWVDIFNKIDNDFNK